MDPKAKKAAPPRRQRRKLLQVRQNAIVLPTFYVSKNVKSYLAGYGFNVHVNKFNGYQELFQFLITAAQASEVEVPDKCTSLRWH
jgi:hypothetical protein